MTELTFAQNYPSLKKKKPPNHPQSLKIGISSFHPKLSSLKFTNLLANDPKHVKNFSKPSPNSPFFKGTAMAQQRCQALCTADISDMVAALTNGPAAGIATTSDCADLPVPEDEWPRLQRTRWGFLHGGFSKI